LRNIKNISAILTLNVRSAEKLTYFFPVKIIEESHYYFDLYQNFYYIAVIKIGDYKLDKTVYDKVKSLKTRFEKEGFIILGIFGSYVRNEQTDASDIDILYDIDDRFLKKYIGWDAVLRLEEIKSEIEKFLNIKADIADKNSLRRISQKYIIPEVISV